MKNYRKIAIANLREYSTLDFSTFEGAEDNPAGYSSNWEKLKWEDMYDQYEISFEKGTLTRDVISHDGKYLMLVFRGNLEFSEPCNMVIYDLTGKLHRVICGPFLSNREIIEKHGGRPDMQGIIIGCGVMKAESGAIFSSIGVRYNEIIRGPGSYSYTEARAFNPETGEIGEIVDWELPSR